MIHSKGEIVESWQFCESSVDYKTLVKQVLYLGYTVLSKSPKEFPSVHIIKVQKD